MSLQKNLITHTILTSSILVTLSAHSALPTSSEYTVTPIPKTEHNLTNQRLDSLEYKTNTSQTTSVAKKNQLVPSKIKNFAYTVNLELDNEALTNTNQENKKIDNSNAYIYPQEETLQSDNNSIQTLENKEIEPSKEQIDSIYTDSQDNQNSIAIDKETTINPKMNSQIDKKISAFLITSTEGQELKTPIDGSTQLKAGDLIEYQSNITNRSKDRVRSMMVNLSIPEEVELIGMIKPNYAMGSIDQQNFYHMPLRTEVNGIAEDIGLDSYRAVQWQIESLDLDETTTVSYRAKVK